MTNGAQTFAIMRLVLVFAVWTLTTHLPAKADDPPANAAIVKIEAAPASGFHSPYLIYIPKHVATQAKTKPAVIMVLPNNTGSLNDDRAFHEKAARRSMEQGRQFGNTLGLVVLKPIFPRPRTDWRIYAHALDRDCLLTDKPELRRPDLQLIAMIDDAAKRLQTDGMNVEPRVFLFGFSASGMFVNRFVWLHPDRVKAAAIGSPGGWPIAPIAEMNGKKLRYPVGVADIDQFTGKPWDAAAVAKAPIFLFMGDKDTNDSVPFRDSFDEEDVPVIMKLFGKTPIERWPVAEKLYREALPNATVKLYPGVGHKVTLPMQMEIGAFFLKHKG